MKNLKDSKTRVTVGYSRTLTGGKLGNWYGCQKCDGKIHCVTLTNMDVIPGLHANLFSVTRSLQKGFQVTAECETLILNKIPTEIRFDKKWRKTKWQRIYTDHQVLQEHKLRHSFGTQKAEARR